MFSRLRSMGKVALRECQNLSSVPALRISQNYCSPASLAGFKNGLSEAEPLVGMSKPVRGPRN